MPYYVHRKDQPPTDGESFTSRQDAHTHKTTHQTVTFFISERERVNWMKREYQRFADGVYIDVPWIRFTQCWTPYHADKPTNDYAIPSMAFHFAHLSLKTPGQIAYTPSDEHGYQDRQVTLNTARYLEKYHDGYFSTSEIADYVARVKALTASFNLATSTEEIVQVYMHGPSSCMSHEVSYYRSHVHPVSVYGESDLAVAYLGEPSDARARCLVWPEKKRYTRVYGDSTLGQLLRNHGYKQHEEENGSDWGGLEGARIRAIRLEDGNGRKRSGYVFPYIDAAASASLSSDGQWFTLHESGEGDYTCDETCGVVGARESRMDRCGRYGCDNRVSDNDNAYCDDCDENSTCCEACNTTVFDGDYRVVGDKTLCDSCASNRELSCSMDGCHTTWHEEDLSRYVRLSEGDPLREYCESCREHMRTCDECSSLYDARDGSTVLPNGYEVCDDCKPEDVDEDTDPPLRYPTIDTTITVYSVDMAALRTFPILYMRGALCVHSAFDGGEELTITHIQSGLCVTSRALPLSEMELLTCVLSKRGIDWGFSSRHSVPSDTFAYAMEVLQSLNRGTARPRDLYLAAYPPMIEEVSPCV